MHNKFHLFGLFIKLFLLGIILGGCDNAGSGGSGSVSLLRGEPVILDSTLSINVSDGPSRMESLTPFLTPAIGFTCGSFG